MRVSSQQIKIFKGALKLCFYLEVFKVVEAVVGGMVQIQYANFCSSDMICAVGTAEEIFKLEIKEVQFQV